MTLLCMHLYSVVHMKLNIVHAFICHYTQHSSKPQPELEEKGLKWKHVKKAFCPKTCKCIALSTSSTLHYSFYFWEHNNKPNLQAAGRTLSQAQWQRTQQGIHLLMSGLEPRTFGVPNKDWMFWPNSTTGSSNNETFSPSYSCFLQKSSLLLTSWYPDLTRFSFRVKIPRILYIIVPESRLNQFK